MEMMSKLVTTAGLAALAAAQISQAPCIVLSEPPNFVRPYVIPHNYGSILGLGSTVYRFPVASPSSGGAMTLLTTNGDASTTGVKVYPHRHLRQYENLFCSRGAVQLWTQQYNAEQNVRKLTAGDFGASPPNSTHTFQIVEPNTERTYGVVFDGGLEKLFFSSGAPNLTYPSFSPYDPNAVGRVASPPPSGPWDIIANPDFVPRRDMVNGSAPAGAGWHDEADALPSDPAQPYYVARDLGPNYLNSEGGSYQVVRPLHTAAQSAGSQQQHNLTLSFISMSMRPADATMPPATHRYAGHAGFRVEDGALVLAVEGYAPAQLLYGDVTFVPGNTSYSCYAPAPVSFTRVLNFATGVDGLDTALIARGVPWNSSVWPTA